MNWDSHNTGRTIYHRVYPSPEVPSGVMNEEAEDGYAFHAFPTVRTDIPSTRYMHSDACLIASGSSNDVADRH